MFERVIFLIAAFATIISLVLDLVKSFNDKE